MTLCKEFSPILQPVILRLGEESNSVTACVDPVGFFARPQNDKPF
jgi:hypothetical protein